MRLADELTFSRSQVRDWLDRLENAWRARDPEAVAALFTPDAVYHRGPFGPPRRGREEIAAHWAETLTGQRPDPRVWFGLPLVDGVRAAVEWWCVLRDPATGAPRTPAGALLLRFAPDGGCAEWHEYFHSWPDTTDGPPAGWFGGDRNLEGDQSR